MECCICKESRTAGFRCCTCTSVLVCAPCFIKWTTPVLPLYRPCPVCQVSLFTPSALDRPVIAQDATRLVAALGADKGIVRAKDAKLEPDMDTKLSRLMEKMEKGLRDKIEMFPDPPGWAISDEDEAESGFDDDCDPVRASTWVANHTFLLYNEMLATFEYACKECAIGMKSPQLEIYSAALLEIKAAFQPDVLTTDARRRVVLERLSSLHRRFYKGT